MLRKSSVLLNLVRRSRSVLDVGCRENYSDIQPMEEDANLDQVGVISNQLSAFLKGQFGMNERHEINLKEIIAKIAVKKKKQVSQIKAVAFLIMKY